MLNSLQTSFQTLSCRQQLFETLSLSSSSSSSSYFWRSLVALDHHHHHRVGGGGGVGRDHGLSPAPFMGASRRMVTYF
ncbi:hypothetical protein M0804_015096 [Polistes exclamans]|nr:hypothetical protein M0804_015097 [Polistes exclamans]KAI4473942.1 hypothetical protein M0804_015096 [Polistes exclamans]